MGAGIGSWKAMGGTCEQMLESITAYGSGFGKSLGRAVKNVVNPRKQMSLEQQRAIVEKLHPKIKARMEKELNTNFDDFNFRVTDKNFIDPKTNKEIKVSAMGQTASGATIVQDGIKEVQMNVQGIADGAKATGLSFEEAADAMISHEYRHAWQSKVFGSENAFQAKYAEENGFAGMTYMNNALELDAYNYQMGKGMTTEEFKNFMKDSNEETKSQLRRNMRNDVFRNQHDQLLPYDLAILGGTAVAGYNVLSSKDK